MSLRNEFDVVESAAASAPLGWRLGMGLCNLLIAASVLSFAVCTVYAMRFLELF